MLAERELLEPLPGAGESPLMAVMNDSLYLILDQGGHSSRALVFDARGQCLALGRCSVASHEPRPGYVEQDPLELVQSLRVAAEEALAQLSLVSVSRLAACGLVTQRSSLVCWHRQTLEPLSPVLSWQDTRAADWLARLDFDREWLRRKTGLVANGHYGASKMRWCLDNLPAVAAAQARGQLLCGPLAAYLAQALSRSARARVDPGNGSRTLLMDCRQQRWDAALLQLFGIPGEILPTLVATVGDYGLLRLGGRVVPLRLVNGDQCSAFYAHGDLSVNTAYINAGSGAFVAQALASEAASSATGLPPGLLQTPVFCTAHGCRFVCEGTVNGAANALDYGATSLGVADYRDLDNWSARQRNVPLFINGVGGLGSPFWRPEFASRFLVDDVGPDVVSDEAKMLAVLESIVFLLTVNLEVMAAHGMQAERLLLSGGVSAFAAFCQRLADLTGLPAFRPDLLEASARGAVYQLISAEASAVAGWVEQSGKCFEPRAGGDPALRARYWRWRQYLPSVPEN